jgi:hypothetical protein
MEKLEDQLEDRLFTIHSDESSDQTNKIIEIAGEKAAGCLSELRDNEIAGWKAFHESLQPVDVVIPFAPDIGAFITRSGSVPIASRRAFNRVLSVIKTVTTAYQFQRTRDSENRLIAEISDYYIALQIVSEAFRESMGQNSRQTDERIQYITDQGPLGIQTMATAAGVTREALYQWVKPRIAAGKLVWCDQSGTEYIDERILQKDKKAGKAFIKVQDTAPAENAFRLPSLFDLTKDSAWDEDGEKYQLYNLDLERRFTLVEVSQCGKVCQKSDLGTPICGQLGDIPEEAVVKDQGGKVARLNMEETSDENSDNPEDDNTHETKTSVNINDLGLPTF